MIDEHRMSFNFECTLTGAIMQIDEANEILSHVVMAEHLNLNRQRMLSTKKEGVPLQD
jgi:hypothetical protein